MENDNQPNESNFISDEMFNQEMQKSYESILFLGTSLFSSKTFDKEFLLAYISVMKHFMMQTDYAKVESVIDLLLLLENKNTVEIDSSIIDEINASPN